MPRSASPPLAGGEQGATGKVLADLLDTPPFSASQAAAAVTWLLRQPQTDLNELAGRDWPRVHRGYTLARLAAAVLAARLAMATNAADRLAASLALAVVRSAQARAEEALLESDALADASASLAAQGAST